MQDELIDYVKRTLSEGHSARRIKAALKQAGYEKEDIEHAFEVAKLAEATPEHIEEHIEEPTHEDAAPKNPEKGYFGRLKEALFSPNKFFEHVDQEQGYKQPLFFLSVTLVIGWAAFSLGFLLATQLLKSFFPAVSVMISALPFTSLLLIFFVSIIFGGLIFSFIGAGIVHLLTKLFGGEGQYEDAYKVIAYHTAPMIPGIILFLIPFIGGLAVFVWQFIIFVFGLSKLYKITHGKAVMIGLLLVMLSALAMLMLGLANVVMPPASYY